MTDAPATNELLPCPFCGSADLETGGDDKFVGVRCRECEATGPNHYITGREWNTRAAATPSAGVSVEELADFLDHLDVLRIAGSANDDEAELARALLDQFEIRRK